MEDVLDVGLERADARDDAERGLGLGGRGGVGGGGELLELRVEVAEGVAERVVGVVQAREGGAERLGVLLGDAAAVALGEVGEREDGADDVAVGVAVAGGVDLDAERLAVGAARDGDAGRLVVLAGERLDDGGAVGGVEQQRAEGLADEVDGGEAPDAAGGLLYLINNMILLKKLLMAEQFREQ